MPKLSIIVPVYNKEKYVHKCIQSILSQTYSDFELILVNDGSSDNSGLKCDHYQDIDPRIIVIHQKNQGVSSARNEGLKIAKGEYVGFIDSDDTIERDMYYDLVRNALDNDADISMCKLREKFTQPSYSDDQQLISFNQDEALNAFFNGNLDYSACNKIFRLTVVKGIQFEGTMFEDAFYTFKSFCLAKNTVMTQNRLYNYFNSDNSVSLSKFSVKYMQISDFTKKIVELVSEKAPTHFQAASALDIVMNLSILNLILFAGTNKYIKEYQSTAERLSYYADKLATLKTLNKKHLIAYRMFRFSPKAYFLALKTYCLMFPSHVGARG